MSSRVPRSCAHVNVAALLLLQIMSRGLTSSSPSSTSSASQSWAHREATGLPDPPRLEEARRRGERCSLVGRFFMDQPVDRRFFELLLGPG
eukprot:16447881-Heterocapsa_arctica.AAC.1